MGSQAHFKLVIMSIIWKNEWNRKSEDNNIIDEKSAQENFAFPERISLHLISDKVR